MHYNSFPSEKCTLLIDIAYFRSCKSSILTQRKYIVSIEMDQVMEKYLKNENGIEKKNGIQMDNIRENESALAREHELEMNDRRDLESGLTRSTENESEKNHAKENGTGGNPTTEALVEVDRKISCMEWFMVSTGPVVMPFFSVFIIYFGKKTYDARKSGEREKAIKNKTILVGLGQWAYRVATTIFVFVILFVMLIQLDRFG